MASADFDEIGAFVGRVLGDEINRREAAGEPPLTVDELRSLARVETVAALRPTSLGDHRELVHRIADRAAEEAERGFRELGHPDGLPDSG